MVRQGRWCRWSSATCAQSCSGMRLGSFGLGVFVQVFRFPFFAVTLELHKGGLWAYSLGPGSFLNRQAAGHEGAPSLVGASRVLVNVCWSSSSRAKGHTFTGTREWGPVQNVC